MSKKNKLFSGSLGGFNKAEVIEYIEEMNRKAKMAKEEFDYELSRLENENAGLEEKINEFDCIKEELSKTKEELYSVSCDLGELKNEMLQKNEALALKEEQEKSLAEQMAQLEEAKSGLSAECDKMREYIAALENERKMLSDDVENQRGIIMALQERKAENDAEILKLKSENQVNKAKADQYELDKTLAGGIAERTKEESTRLLTDAKLQAEELILSAKRKASSILEDAEIAAQKKSELAVAESRREVAENMKKVKYLQKRRKELLSAFQKVKDAAGGFYDNVANTLGNDDDSI